MDRLELVGSREFVIDTDMDKAILMDLEVDGFDVSVEIMEIDPWANDLAGTFEYNITKVDGHGEAHLPVNTDKLDLRIREGLERANYLFM